MHVKILERLKQIEKDYQVKILLAVESGSRAWGFPSKDSDYDVRFIYAHNIDWYLSVFEGRDVIELPIDSIFDINGWDLKKSLQLLRRSNPALLEWLNSPIVYIEHPAILPLKQLASLAFIPISSCSHYLSMAKNNFSKCKNRPEVKIKAYLYALRPLLCCLWVIEHQTQPPMLFEDLLNHYLKAGEIRTEINHLLSVKQSTTEQDYIPKSNVLEKYINQQFIELKNRLPSNSTIEKKEMFNQTFRETLNLLK